MKNNNIRTSFEADQEYPTKLWAIFDCKEGKLVERSKQRKESKYTFPRIYKSYESAGNYLENWLNNDKHRYKICEFTTLDI